MLFLTEDGSVGLLRFESQEGDCVSSDVITDELAIFEEYETELLEWGVITQEEVKYYDKLLNEKYENQRLQRDEEYDKRRYEQYLELKKEFEVDYKL